MRSNLNKKTQADESRDVEAEAVLFLWKRKRENSTASAST